MANLFVLFEHAAGYGVFKVKEFEEIGMILPQLKASIHDLSKFKNVVQLVSFSPFKTALKALENINAVSEGLMTEDLHQVLDVTIPKRKKTILGVSDPKLAASINEALGIQCSHIGAVPEVIRGEFNLTDRESHN
ncbi:nucleolar protein 56-like [Euwallacea similis]|uniref:nucleolar protein 56-like n=1 Tax=Euwallacea similis TaxID=1736056 RepID=UPI00344F5F89